MNGLGLLNSSCCCLEISHDCLKALRGEVGFDLNLDRQADGSLTAACRELVIQRLSSLLRRQSWQPRLRVFCALGARGVTLRRLSLPASTQGDLSKLLSLQVESEFPLPPEELAWGYAPIPRSTRSPAGPNGTQEFLVAAIKRTALEEFLEILAFCGATPVFTLAAWARSRVCPHAPASFAVLELGQRSSELAVFENGLPTTVRVLPWGGQDLAEAPAGAPVSQELPLQSLAKVLDGPLAARKIYLTGPAAGRPDLASQLAAFLDNHAECEVVRLAPGEGRSAAVLGLRQTIEQDGAWPALVLETKGTNGRARAAQPAPLRWAALAAVLALCAVAAPYAEAFFLKARLAGNLAAMKHEKGRLGTVDRELDFLRYLKQNQPPYLDVLFLMSKAAPPGTRVDNLSMSRRGDVSMRGSIKDPQQLADFRSKLLDAGCFTNVVVEEQSPTPDRQELTVRMSAQWDSSRGRDALASALAASDTARPKPAAKEGPPGKEGPPRRHTASPSPTEAPKPGPPTTPSNP